MNPAADASLAHLLGHLQLVEARVRSAVALRRARDNNPDDRFRGLYISDEEVDHLLNGGRPHAGNGVFTPQPVRDEVEAKADLAETAGADLRLRRLARTFTLDSVDVELLVLALAPDLDARFERLFAYLHDDVSRRRASTGLAMALHRPTIDLVGARRRFGSASPLIAGGLLEMEEPDRPFLTRPLRVPDRVGAHLVGDDAPDELVQSMIVPAMSVELDRADVIARSLRSGVRLFYVRERIGSGGGSFAATALSEAGAPVMVIDLRRLDPKADLMATARTVIRETRLRGARLVVGPVDAIADQGPSGVRFFTEAPCTVALVGARNWDPSWSAEPPLIVESPVLSREDRIELWRLALDGVHPLDADPAVATAQFRLNPEQVVAAAGVARQRAAGEGRALGAEDMRAGARAQNSAGLERLARRIEPRAGWRDLVLPTGVEDQLRELTTRLHHRDVVLDAWGMGARSSKGRGITCLFAGGSGTGKTMSAEVVAGDLGLDLYVIDLSTVVDKYVGETEKNLDRIFGEAEGVNGVLLFDEADALFGKRSEVKDARDRWANIEVAYLLQRMELFDGMAILTTNLRANLDEAFTRRLDSVIDFPSPDEEHRLALWRKNLSNGLPLAEGIELEFLASSFKLTGGDIRNIAVAAAYFAAEEGGPLDMHHLIRATQREYRKLGRLCVEAEFGPYYNLVSPVAAT